MCQIPLKKWVFFFFFCLLMNIMRGFQLIGSDGKWGRGFPKPTELGFAGRGSVKHLLRKARRHFL